MAAPIQPELFKEALIVLGAATLVIPVFHRAKVSPIIGYILVGMAIGPYALGTLAGDNRWLNAILITEPERMAPFAELGVMLVLFMIGLELSFERLALMRRYVLGLGGLQLMLTMAAVAGVARAIGLDWTAALVVGAALAMSSSAIVIQVLAERKKLTAPVGRMSFAILVMQDIAVVPILFLISASGRSPDALGPALALAVGQAALAVGAAIVLGRLLLRPLFRQVARTESPELFLAACLLVILLASFGMAAAGLSPAMGALLAGLLLAETEYRRQIEVLIEPFKGLLLGVFLISIGATIDLGAVARAPLALAGGAIALVVAKTAIVALLFRLFGDTWRRGARAGLLLAPGGEFAFVILGAAGAAGLIAAGESNYVAALAAVTMALIPLFGALGERLADRTTAPAAALTFDAEPQEASGAVVIAGYGRVGKVVAEMLAEHNVPYIVFDSDPDRVRAARREGRRGYFGDLSNTDLLGRIGLENARALVATMDAPAKIEAVVAAARAARPDLMIVARARDARHAARLYQLGVNDAAPETIEASLQLAEAVLVDIGVAMGPVIASIHDKRAAFRRDAMAGAQEEPRARFLSRRNVSKRNAPDSA